MGTDTIVQVLDGPRPSWTRSSASAAGRDASILIWYEALTAPTFEEGVAALRSAYVAWQPRHAEFVVAPGCSFQCMHCIYPKHFARCNPTLAAAQWRGILKACADDLQMTTFVHGGRSLDRVGMDVLETLRSDAPRARIGLIDNGISFRPFQRALLELGLDWIDISLDGLARDHDRQRGRPGAFDEAMEGAVWLLDHQAAPRVNVLTCLTTLNADSVCDMIRAAYELGFRNFFVSPVTVVDNRQPDPSLRLDGLALYRVVQDLQALHRELPKVCIQVNIFATEYLAELWKCGPSRVEVFKPCNDGLVYCAREGSDADSSLVLNYYPSSLAGTREFIVNTSGSLVLPRAVSYGQAPPELVVGSLLDIPAKALLEMLPTLPAFNGYIHDLRGEREMLRPLLRS